MDNDHEQSSKCQEGDKRNSDAVNIKTHMESEHEIEIVCHQCEKMFDNDEAVMSHIGTDHPKSKLDCTFINPSLLN